MLILSRDLGEEVVIVVEGVEVIVKVIELRGASARLGFTAPKHIPVHRKEVYERQVSEGNLHPGTKVG